MDWLGWIFGKVFAVDVWLDTRPFLQLFLGLLFVASFFVAGWRQASAARLQAEERDAELKEMRDQIEREGVGVHILDRLANIQKSIKENDKKTKYSGYLFYFLGVATPILLKTFFGIG